MVTTRSADKRVDARDDELVLRSRTVMSPATQDSTPSRLRKRNKNNDDDDTPVVKRTRRLVSVEISLPRPAASASSHSTAQDDDATIVVASNTHEKGRPNSTDAASRDGAVESEMTPRQHEVFRTPATSRHKRFDSTDPEDTIVVNRDVRSNSQEGYETAEEVIADSDEAPEIQTTKTRSSQPQPAQSLRASGRRGRARASDFFSQPQEDKTTSVEVAQGAKRPIPIDESTKVSAQIQQKPEILVLKSPNSGEVLESRSDNLETGIVPDLPESATDSIPFIEDTREQKQEKEAAEHVVDITGSAYLPENTVDAEPETASIKNTIDALPDSTLSVFANMVSSPHSTTKKERQMELPRSRIDSSLSVRPNFRSKQDFYKEAVRCKYSSHSRLPDSSKSSRSRFIRQKLESGKANLKSTWPSKRSAFVTI